MSGRTWQPIETATHDESVEILIRDENGALSLAAWWSRPPDDAEPGWYRRAEGGWDLFDGFGPQEVHPASWWPVPQESQS